MGQDLARWIWITVISLLILGAVGTMGLEIGPAGSQLGEEKTGMLLRSLPDNDSMLFRYGRSFGGRCLQRFHHVNDVVADRIQHEFTYGVHAQFSHQVRPVRIGRFHA